jgi:hypothetical protein
MVVVGAQLSFYPPMLLRRRTGSACKLRFRRKAARSGSGSRSRGDPLHQLQKHNKGQFGGAIPAR